MIRYKDVSSHLRQLVSRTLTKELHREWTDAAICGGGYLTAPLNLEDRRIAVVRQASGRYLSVGTQAYLVTSHKSSFTAFIPLRVKCNKPHQTELSSV